MTAALLWVVRDAESDIGDAAAHPITPRRAEPTRALSTYPRTD
ncbi:hypothetical protein [Streptomyces roseicoloratus]|nr:hypothetical protein [Streptomyces roseicoloratus]